MVTEPVSASEVWSSVKTDGVIETESAFVVVQFSMVVWPVPVTVGVKVKLMVGAEPAGTTVTVTEFVV
jgi:hypothetical protein